MKTKNLKKRHIGDGDGGEENNVDGGYKRKGTTSSTTTAASLPKRSPKMPVTPPSQFQTLKKRTSRASSNQIADTNKNISTKHNPTSRASVSLASTNFLLPSPATIDNASQAAEDKSSDGDASLEETQSFKRKELTELSMSDSDDDGEGFGKVGWKPTGERLRKRIADKKRAIATYNEMLRIDRIEQRDKVRGGEPKQLAAQSVEARLKKKVTFTGVES